MHQFSNAATVLALVAINVAINFPEPASATDDNPVVNSCSVLLDVPDHLSVNDNDDDADEKWDMNVESVSDESDTVKITVTGTADKKDATVTVTLLQGDGIPRVNGFWPGTNTIDGESTGTEPDGKEKRSTRMSPFTFTCCAPN